MALTLTEDFQLENKPQPHFYTEDEQTLLAQLEQGLVETLSHDQVMENLRHKLGLNEK